MKDALEYPAEEDSTPTSAAPEYVPPADDEKVLPRGYIEEFNITFPTITDPVERGIHNHIIILVVEWILKGRAALTRFYEDIKEEHWQYYKRVKEVDLWFRKGGCRNCSFRASTVFDFPPTVVLDYCAKIPLRLKWDEEYESLKFLHEFRLNTNILYIKFKANWPAGPRDSACVFHAYRFPDQSIHMGCVTTEHPDVPVDPTGKYTRMHAIFGHYTFLSRDGGKRCEMTHYAEFNFGGSLPRGLVQSGAADKYVANMGKLRKLLMKEQKEYYTKPVAGKK